MFQDNAIVDWQTAVVIYIVKPRSLSRYPVVGIMYKYRYEVGLDSQSRYARRHRVSTTDQLPKKKKKTNRLPPWRDTIPDYRITRMPVTRDSNIHRALHLDAITIAIAIAIRRPRIMQLRNNAQIPLRIRPRFRSRPIIQVHILLVDPRPGSIRRG